VQQPRVRVSPLCAFVDHVAVGTVEMVAVQHRPGRATVLTLNQKHPWATLAHDGITALRVATAPG